MLNQFKEYLKDVSQVKQGSIPYYSKWIRECYAFWGKEIYKKLSNEERQSFLEVLSIKYEDWQVKQADFALKLYNHFLLKKEKKNGSLSSQEWDKLYYRTISALRLRHRSYRTEKTYLSWLKRFKEFVTSKHPNELTGEDVQNFLTYLAIEKKISSSTQNQALNAILFVFKHVLKKDISHHIDSIRARQNRRLPVVLTKREIKLILDKMSGDAKLMAMLMYGCGLRVSECIRLRVKDIDLEQGIVVIRSGKGDKDRITILPESLKEALIDHMEEIRNIYEEDRKNNIEGVYLPNALSRKYPRANKEWGWFWLFPSRSLSVDPKSKVIRRHHIHTSTIQRAFNRAVREAKITKQATLHSLRHSFATHLIEDGYDIRTVQELLGHKHIQTTMIYTHVARRNILGVKSPLDVG